MIDLKEILGKYKSDYDKRPSVNFSDITVNLLAGANALARKGNIKKSNKYIEYVRQYLRLLDDFPEFKEKELTCDIPRDGTVQEYIEEKFKELRNMPYKR